MFCLARGLERNRSFNRRCRPKSSKTNHGKTPILDFDITAASQFLFRPFRRKAKGVVQAGNHVLKINANNGYTSGCHVRHRCKTVPAQAQQVLLLPPKIYEYMHNKINTRTKSTSHSHKCTYLSGGTSTHIVGSTSRSKELIVELNESSKNEHLGLAPSRDKVPSFLTSARNGIKA